MKSFRTKEIQLQVQDRIKTHIWQLLGSVRFAFCRDLLHKVQFGSNLCAHVLERSTLVHVWSRFNHGLPISLPVQMYWLQEYFTVTCVTPLRSCAIDFIGRNNFFCLWSRYKRDQRKYIQNLEHRLTQKYSLKNCIWNNLWTCVLQVKNEKGLVTSKCNVDCSVSVGY